MPASSLDFRCASPADLEAGRGLLRGGSKSFYAASFLLPNRVRDPATALYAFCRLADDEIDLADQPAKALRALRQRLDRVYEGSPLPVSADRTLADVVRQFAIPRELLDALLEGFAWDAEGRAYETESEVFDYSARVAGTVGAMMALLMGTRDPDLIARACDLGVAMQLSNIARDVGEDASRGRLYLPRAWLREAGIDPDAWLADPDWSPALGQVVSRLLDSADALYARADLGIAGLPFGCRPGIGAARRLYAEIGHEVRRRGCDSVSQRAMVSAGRKAALLPLILACALRSLAPRPVSPLAETRFLVDAVRHCPPPPVRATGPAGIEGRVVWVLELFERLDERDRERRAQAMAGVGPAMRGLAPSPVRID